MVKILTGLAAVVVIAVGGFFGFEFYTQHRIAGGSTQTIETVSMAPPCPGHSTGNGHLPLRSTGNRS